MNITKNNQSDEELLRIFFEKSKSEIPDNGFSQKVMSRLPDEKKLNWIVWIFAAAGISVTLYIVLSMQIVIHLPSVTEGKVWLALVAGVFVIPFLACPALRIANLSCYSFTNLSKYLPQF